MTFSLLPSAMGGLYAMAEAVSPGPTSWHRLRPMFSGWVRSTLVGLALAVGAAWAANRYAPWPAAEVARGTEEPFVRGLFPREIPPGRGPQRWTGARALVRFGNLPAGGAELEGRLHGHRGPGGGAVG